MNKEVANWVASAKYDLDTAEVMYKSRRYIYVVFFCHLAIEKALKAVVTENTSQIPPKSHDLVMLAKLANIKFGAAQREFIGRLNTASVVTRYPEDISAIYKTYTRKLASESLVKARETVEWIISHLR